MTYTHRVHFYETDKMGITHHSNYIRWMEEARCAFLEDIGWGYGRIESLGVGSPVTAVSVEYRRPTTFDDEVRVEVSIEKWNGVRLTVGYTLWKDGELVAKGSTSHCFLNPEGSIIRVNREYPELFEAIKSYERAPEVQ